jgi:hypothetical protein
MTVMLIHCKDADMMHELDDGVIEDGFDANHARSNKGIR